MISLRLTKPQACHLIERRFVTWLGTGLLLNRTRVCYLTKRSLATLHVPVTPPRHIHLPLTQVVHDDFHLMGKGKVANATTLQMWRMLQCCKCCSLFFPHTRVRARDDNILFLPVRVVLLWQVAAKMRSTMHWPYPQIKHVRLRITQVVHDDFHLMGKGKVANTTTLQIWRMLQCCKCCSLFFPHTRVRARDDNILFLPVRIVLLWQVAAKMRSTMHQRFQKI